MKVHVLNKGTIGYLEHRLLAEGDSIVPLEDAELVITDSPLGVEANCPVVSNACFELPHDTVQNLGIDIHKGEIAFIISKWFDMGWSPQTLVGVPLQTSQDQGLGARAHSGLATRYVDGSEIAKVYDNDGLEGLLTTLRHIGMVTCEPARRCSS